MIWPHPTHFTNSRFGVNKKVHACDIVLKPRIYEVCRASAEVHRAASLEIWWFGWTWTKHLFLIKMDIDRSTTIPAISPDTFLHQCTFARGAIEQTNILPYVVVGIMYMYLFCIICSSYQSELIQLW